VLGAVRPRVLDDASGVHIGLLLLQFPVHASVLEGVGPSNGNITKCQLMRKPDFPPVNLCAISRWIMKPPFKHAGVDELMIAGFMNLSG